MIRNRAHSLGLPADALQAIEDIDLQLVQGIGDQTGGMSLPPDFIDDFEGMGLAAEARNRMELLSQTLKTMAAYADIAELIKAFDVALARMYEVVQMQRPENLDGFMYVDPAILIFEKARFIVFKDLGLLEKTEDSPPLIFALMPRPDDFGPIYNQPPVDFNDDTVWVLPYPGKEDSAFAANLRKMMIQTEDPAQIANMHKLLLSNLMGRINENFDRLNFASTPPTGDARSKFVEALAVLLAEPMDPAVFGFDPGYNPGIPGAEPGWEGPEPGEPILERYQKLYGTLIKLETPKVRNGVSYEYALKEVENSDTTSFGGWANQYHAYIFANNEDLSEYVGTAGICVLKFLSEPLSEPTSSQPEAPGFTFVEFHPDPAN